MIGYVEIKKSKRNRKNASRTTDPANLLKHISSHVSRYSIQQCKTLTPRKYTEIWIQLKYISPTVNLGLL